MTLAELADDLGLTRARVSQLRTDGLIVLRGGQVDKRATIERLWLYWCPSDGWWDKPVGPVGRELRRRWREEQQRSGIGLEG